MAFSLQSKQQTGFRIPKAQQKILRKAKRRLRRQIQAGKGVAAQSALPLSLTDSWSVRFT